MRGSSAHESILFQSYRECLHTPLQPSVAGDAFNSSIVGSAPWARSVLPVWLRPDTRHQCALPRHPSARQLGAAWRRCAGVQRPRRKSRMGQRGTRAARMAISRRGRRGDGRRRGGGRSLRPPHHGRSGRRRGDAATHQPASARAIARRRTVVALARRRNGCRRPRPLPLHEQRGRRAGRRRGGRGLRRHRRERRRSHLAGGAAVAPAGLGSRAASAGRCSTAWMYQRRPSVSRDELRAGFQRSSSATLRLALGLPSKVAPSGAAVDDARGDDSRTSSLTRSTATATARS